MNDLHHSNVCLQNSIFSFSFVNEWKPYKEWRHLPCATDTFFLFFVSVSSFSRRTERNLRESFQKKIKTRAPPSIATDQFNWSSNFVPKFVTISSLSSQHNLCHECSTLERNLHKKLTNIPQNTPRRSAIPTKCFTETSYFLETSIPTMTALVIITGASRGQ